MAAFRRLVHPVLSIPPHGTELISIYGSTLLWMFAIRRCRVEEAETKSGGCERCSRATIIIASAYSYTMI